MYISGSTASTGHVIDPWSTWASSSTTTTTDTIYLTWISASSTTSAVTGEWAYRPTADGSTFYRWVDNGNGTIVFSKPEERRTAAERQRELDRLAVAEYRRQCEADQRATKLLIAHLDEQQLKDWQGRRAFRLVGQDGRRYEIDVRKRMHNVFLLDDVGERVEELCIYQQGDTPLADNALAQKLLLEADVARFRRIANATELRRVRA